MVEVSLLYEALDPKVLAVYAGSGLALGLDDSHHNFQFGEHGGYKL
jgi:hypothetical protein